MAITHTQIKETAKAIGRLPCMIYNNENINYYAGRLETISFRLELCRSLRTKFARKRAEELSQELDDYTLRLRVMAKQAHDNHDFVALSICFGIITAAKNTGTDIAKKLRSKAIDKKAFCYDMIAANYTYTPQSTKFVYETQDVIGFHYYKPCTAKYPGSIAVDEYLAMTRPLSAREFSQWQDEQARRAQMFRNDEFAEACIETAICNEAFDIAVAAEEAVAACNEAALLPIEPRIITASIAELKAKSDVQAQRLADIKARIDTLNAEIDEFKRDNIPASTAEVFNVDDGEDSHQTDNDNLTIDLQIAADNALHPSEQFISEITDEYLPDSCALMNCILDERDLQKELARARERLSLEYRLAYEAQDEERRIRDRVYAIYAIVDEYDLAIRRLQNCMDYACGIGKHKRLADVISARMEIRRALVAIVDALDNHAIS